MTPHDYAHHARVWGALYVLYSAAHGRTPTQQWEHNRATGNHRGYGAWLRFERARWEQEGEPVELRVWLEREHLREGVR